MPLMTASSPPMPVRSSQRAVPEATSRFLHRLRVSAAILAATGLIGALAYIGWPYYLAGPAERVLSPLHPQLRSSGTWGLKLGILGVMLFGVLFLYPLRKRWKWLGSIGSTRRWLDFHVVAGVTAPIIITFHAGFRTHGLAGLAYWIMIIVALSGFIGRYVYAQIPRSLNSTRLSLGDLRDQIDKYAAILREQPFFEEKDLVAFFDLPDPKQVRSMSLWTLLWTMIRLDLSRPFLVSRLRGRALLHASGVEWVFTCGGLLPSHNKAMEDVITSVRRQSRLNARMAFLDRAERIFHLWHVIHRPFSLSFVALVFIHIGVAAALGYYS